MKKAGTRWTPGDGRFRRTLAVFSLSAASTRGLVRLGNLNFPCALGRSGRRALKREGDGASPRGAFRVVQAFYRSDRQRRPRTGVPIRPLRANDGWCDSVNDRNYNRLVAHPYPASAERMWRHDHLYDLVVVLDHNQRPRVRGLGSAIFMHVASADHAPTAGCIALSPRDLRHVLERLARGVRILIGQ